MANFKGVMAHGPPATQPRFLFFLKIAIIVLSVVVLALAAYAISLYGNYSSYYVGAGAPGLLIFTVIWTWVTYGVFLFFELKAPHFFYRIIAIVLWGLSIIFWLSAWALAASHAAVYLSYTSYSSGFGSTYYDDWFKKAGGALAGCAGIGALIWILIIVHFAFFVRACLTDTTTTGAELGNIGHKHEATAAPAPAAAPGQYQAQPVYQQQQQTHPQHPQQTYPQQQAYPTQ